MASNVSTYWRAMSRRSVLAAGVSAGALLAACGTSGSGAGQAGGAGGLSAAPATLSFLGRGSPANQQMFPQLCSAFSKENPGITVQYTHEPSNFDQKWTVLASSGQLPDMGFGTVAFFKGQIAGGAAIPVDDLAKRD